MMSRNIPYVYEPPVLFLLKNEWANKSLPEPENFGCGQLAHRDVGLVVATIKGMCSTQHLIVVGDNFGWVREQKIENV